MILLKILWIFLNFLVAAIHAGMINRNDGRKIRHSLWGGGLALIAGGFGYLFYRNGAPWWDIVILAVDFMLARFVVFNLSLNAMRKGQYAVGLFYVTPEVKNINWWTALWKGKIIDWIHWRVWNGEMLLCYIIYSLASLLITVYFLAFGYEPFTKNIY